jgi:hypothetical protein
MPLRFETSASTVANQALHNTFEEDRKELPRRLQGPKASSGDDAVGKRRRNRIMISPSEKRALTLLASVPCHTRLKRQGKIGSGKTFAEGGREINWNTCKTFSVNGSKCVGSSIVLGAMSESRNPLLAENHPDRLVTSTRAC